ncbi:hypothetical protein DS885_03815 [Psychromonas sp. B3M02]|uniref:hypothetical protein n=1 Tax=Psychromonas sp. B3M02 TaxID=2267226 RepID=UPI000DE93A13|nr:hypothetical protein [Psychromonas sp. B3M02]RBW47283.1 hypothetical protein DS885_03815 [Psychromonas sp. B3M02]
MKNSTLIASLLLSSLITGCSKEEPKTQFASQKSFNELQQQVLNLTTKQENLNSLIYSFKSKLEGNNLAIQSIRDEITELRNEVNSKYQPLNEAQKNTENDIKIIDESLNSVLDRLKKIESLSVKKEVNIKHKINTATKAKPKRKKIITPSPKISVSNINKWGSSYVAVIYSAKNGYKTVTEKEGIGDGWGVLSIDLNTVTFIHASGKIESVSL